MMSLPQLESWLLNAANIIRGPVDPSDYKAYIFPLLFFKRISDVYEEEYEQALEESNGDIEYAEFEENHRFIIPKGCRWSDLQAKTTNIGAAISSIFRRIELANRKTLSGIFGDVEWKNKDKLSDERLKNLVEHFSLHNLSIKNVEPDMAGRAYEYLIKRFADKTNKKAGEFYTPRSIVKLMTLILDPCEGESVYDPACGEDVIIVTRGKNAVFNRVLKLPQSHKTTNWCAA
ncbi:type I restriction-modification system subunit M [Peptoclostridium acidaminophilum]|nr:type I restriction-modification system subunit M N-terminal domain-containing protein [Peptoclostridium acidaminophilum]